jgi:PST family polysaccharide transporter
VTDPAPQSGSPPDGPPDDEPEDTDDGLLGESLTGVFWTAVENGGKEVISSVFHIVLAQLLLPKHFGLIAMAFIAMSFINRLQDQGFASAIIQRDQLEREHLDTGFWTVLGLGFALSIVGWFVAPLLAWFFGEPQLTDVFRVMVLAVPLSSANNIPDALLRRQMRFKVLSARSLFAQLVAGIVAIGLALDGWGVWALVSKTIIHAVVAALVLWPAADWWPRFWVSKRHLDDLFSFGINITGSKIMNFANRQADDLVIGYFLGSAALGYYSVAYELIRGLEKLLSGTMTSVAFPAFSRLQFEPERLGAAFIGGIRATALFAFPIFMLLMALAPELIPFIFGEQWQPSAPIARVLCFIGMFHSVALFNSPVLNGAGKPDWDFKMTIGHSLGNVIGFLIAVQFGALAVAAAFVIRGYLLIPIEIYLVSLVAVFPARDYLKAVGFPLVGCGLMVAGVLGLKPFISPLLSTWAALGVYIPAGLGIYIGYAWLFLPDALTDLIEMIRDELDDDDEASETSDDTDPSDE